MSTPTKELVRLRKKSLKDGGSSLYLDIYRDGKREYEFLKLYLTNGKSTADKQKDKETLQFANSIKAKRIVEIQNGEYGFMDKFKLDTNFLDYYQSFMETKKDSKGNYGNWASAYKYIKAFTKKTTTFKDIDERYVERFKKYLEKEARTKSDQPLSQNTKHSYFNKLKACLNQVENPIQITPSFPI